MTPEQKVRYLVLAKAGEWESKYTPYYNSGGDQLDALWEELIDNDEYWDAKSEVRAGEVETDIPCQSSRHYESKSVAAKLPDGSWVGWTYWYGGGKHGEPDAVNWIEYAYDLTCTEEEKVVVVRTFEKTTS